MSDSATNRLPGVDPDAVFVARDKAVTETPFAGTDCDEFFPEDSLKATTLPFIGPRQNRPDNPHNLISITPSAPLDLDLKADEENTPETAPWRPSAAQVAIVALSIFAVVEFALLASASRNRQPASVTPATGTVAVESTPPGAKITIDGLSRGVTPVTLSLRPGEYTMSLAAGHDVRNVRLVVPRGNSTERFYFDDSDVESSLATGREIPTPKPAAPVPTAAPLPPVGAVGGWLMVDAPVDLQLFERGALVGSSQTDRIMLPVGRHVIEAANATLGYKTSSTVQVSAGSVTRLKPEMPNGTLNINAIPWAEVAIDGKKLGPTPLGDVSLPIGSHEVVFTHPQLGERRLTAIVTLNGLNRVSVNLNQR